MPCAVLYEFGQTVPQGIVHIKRLEAVIADEAIDLPDIVREECRDLLARAFQNQRRGTASSDRAGCRADDYSGD
jgi:hypothetical protein